MPYDLNAYLVSIYFRLSVHAMENESTHNYRVNYLKNKTK